MSEANVLSIWNPVPSHQALYDKTQDVSAAAPASPTAPSVGALHPTSM